MPLFIVVWVAVTLVALLSGIRYDWPDNVHVDYGVPLTWATNTLSTFVGPANAWGVNLGSLFVDLVFWLGVMTVVVVALLWKIKT